jgi:hypothetical protein
MLIRTVRGLWSGNDRIFKLVRKAFHPGDYAGKSEQHGGNASGDKLS